MSKQKRVLVGWFVNRKFKNGKTRKLPVSTPLYALPSQMSRIHTELMRGPNVVYMQKGQK